MKHNFLKGLEELLKNTPEISEEEVKKAVELLQNQRKEKLRSLVAKRGQCFNCRQEMEYLQPPATSHVLHGNEWLSKHILRWKKPVTVGIDINKKKVSKINLISVDTAIKYICSNCWESEIKPTTSRALQEKIKKNQKKVEAKYKYETAILKSEKQVTPAKAYWVLKERITPDGVKELQEMPYSNFLKTHYWEIVRNYVLYKKNNKCHLCPNNKYLQVHHRTYEHRGSEIFHLDDLIVLCKRCHSKHHDKLAEL